MALLGSILTGLGITAAVKSAKWVADRRGWLPASYYWNLADQAVADGDLDTAIRNNQRARQRQSDYVPAQAQRQMLLMVANQHATKARVHHCLARETLAKQEQRLIALKRQRMRRSLLATVIPIASGYAAGLLQMRVPIYACYGVGALASLITWSALHTPISEATLAVTAAQRGLEIARQKFACELKRRAMLN